MSEIKYNDKITKRVMRSNVYKDSFSNPHLHARLDILKNAVDYILRKETLKGLKEFLEKRFPLNGSLDAWITELEKVERKIQQTPKKLDTRIRALYPTIIAELIYQEHQDTFGQLSLWKTTEKF